MTREIRIIDADGATRIGPDAFPLAIGGPDSVVSVEGRAASDPSGWIGIENGELFLQPADSGTPVLCNGTPVTASQWLRDGDEIRVGSTRVTVEVRGGTLKLVVEPIGGDEQTEPPLLAPSTDPSTTIAPVAFKPRTAVAERRTGLRIRPVAIVTWIALLALFGIAWILFTARSVEVVVEPPAERVAFEGGWLRWQFGDRWIVRPGTYTVVAEKAGYRPLESPVTITANSPGTLNFALEKLPGRLMIESGSVVGAEILIDGELAGQTPLEPVELPPGEHEVRIEAEDFADFVTQVTIAGEGKLQTLEVALHSLRAPVTIRSRPAGATLRIDDQPFGVTPTTVDLLEGRHSVRLTLSGYKTARGRVDVVAEQPLKLAPFELIPAEGILKLRSEPSGATVTVNDEYRGLAPLDLDLEPGQTHRIEVSKASYITASREIVVASGHVREWTATLEVLLGELQIAARPPDAELIVDGESRGRADQTLTLTATPHEIEIRKPGFVPFHTRVTPRSGFPQSIDVTLKSTEQARAESRPAEITTSQGQQMVLIEGGRFRMGASRREPGRRANESLHDVELTRAFYMATTEVSNRQFREFRRRHLSGKVGQYNLEIGHHPVVRVTWQDAVLYCNWLSGLDSLPPAYVIVGGEWVVARPVTTGYRLPTEAEWALAARFPDGGSESLKYPWGDSLPAVDGSGNYADESTDGLLKRSLSGYKDAFPATAPVESFSPNVLGLFNLGGNVAEWVQDIYSIYPGGSGEVFKDPLGPTEGELHVIRGSSWMDSSITELRLTYRDYGTDARPDLGFRVARYLE